MDDVTLSAVASPTEAHRQKFMERFGIGKGYTDWRALLQEDLDLVCVTTPPFLHRDMVIALLESGKSVICEKPFALNVGRLRQCSMYHLPLQALQYSTISSGSILRCAP